MKAACLGGGPAGLYFAISMRLRDASHDITVFERNRPSDTFGWGLVLSDDALAKVKANDSVSYATTKQHFVYWDDIAVVKDGLRQVASGHGFSGIGCMQLLTILYARAKELGVELVFPAEVDDTKELMDQFNYALLTRSQRISHENLRLRG